MQGLGNDFVVIDAFTQVIKLSHEQIKKIANRHFGIGADQILLVEKPNMKGADFCYRIFNADGNEVEHCGNGARCFAKYVQYKQLTNKDKIYVEVNKTVTTMTCNPDGSVTVEIGIPDFNPTSLPFIPINLTSRAERDCTIWQLANPLTRLKNTEQKIQPVDLIEFGIVSTKNPHAVILTMDVNSAPVVEIAKFLESTNHFPKGINVGFAEIINKHSIKLRVHERGVGETLACGTGACAAAVSGIQRGVLESPVSISMKGGDLLIAWDKNPLNPSPILMTGPAKIVFNGEINLNNL